MATQPIAGDKIVVAAVLVYSTRVCPYCRMAEALLTKKGVSFQKIKVDEDPARLTEMIKRSNRRTVPQIFIGDTHVGGYMDLLALERNGELDELLARP